MSKRMSDDEINAVIELFVNCIYDCNNSDWLQASIDEWINCVYQELITWKNGDGFMNKSNVNRFEGKENIIKRIKPLLIARLKRLAQEGYMIDAVKL